MAEKPLHGGRQIARVLKEEGVKYQFGISGAHVFPIMAGAGEAGIEMVHCRHEQTAAYAADGYARATGKVGICAGTSGPAGTNMVTGLYAAQVDAIPLIAITGQTVTTLLGKDAFQAVDIAEIVKPVTKKIFF